MGRNPSHVLSPDTVDGGLFSHPQAEIKGTWIQLQGAAVPILKPWSCPSSLLTTPPLTKQWGEVPRVPCPPTHPSLAETVEVQKAAGHSHDLV